MKNSNLFIDLLAFGSILSSLLVITSNNPVIAVIFLISTFVNVAGYLILFGIGFIGLSYILVYVGAIAVIFLFVILMINIKISDITEVGSQYTKTFPLALSIGSLFLYELYTILPFTFNNVPSLSALLDISNILNKVAYGIFFSDNANSELASLATAHSTVHMTYNPVIADTAFNSFLQVESIGQGLYTYAGLLLIVTSIILLLSMVAPIYLTHNEN